MLTVNDQLPTVSIVSCTYNSATFIERCMASVQEQTYQRFEHIIQDGGSQDRTIEIVRKKISLSKNVSFQIKEDDGIYSGLNNAVRRCKGDYICFLHSDDEFYDENALQRQVNILTQTAADIVFGDLVFIDRHDARVVRKWVTRNFEEKANYGVWVPPHTTMLVRRTLLQGITFDERFRISSDYDWTLKLLTLSNIRISHNQTNVIKMRTGGASTAGIRAEWIKLKEDLQIIRRHNLHWSCFLQKKLSKISQFLRR